MKKKVQFDTSLSYNCSLTSPETPIEKVERRKKGRYYLNLNVEDLLYNILVEAVLSCIRLTIIIVIIMSVV